MTMESTIAESRPPPALPTTPDHDAPSAQHHPGVRRVHTLPAKLVGGRGSVGPALDTVETLFVHAEAKVVSFSVAGTRPSSSSGQRPFLVESASGTLSWMSPTERTLAAGPLRIYRVPSSGVSFLNSGSLLHPILQRSQCWCVDEESKFVLRVREGSFYRIELPFATKENKAAVDEFKKVLSTVLQYEKTPSPFRRGYVAEPAEQPKTPVRKSEKPKERAKKWRLNKVWEPEDPEHRARLSPASKEEDGPASWRGHLRPRPNTAVSPGSAGSAESEESIESTEDKGTTTDSSTVEDRALKAESHTETSQPINHDRLDLGSARADRDVSRNEVTASEHDHNPSVSEHGSPQTPRIFTLPLRLRPGQSRSLTAPVHHLSIETSPIGSVAPLSRSQSRDSDAASVASQDSFYSADALSIAPESSEAVYHEDLMSSTVKRSNHQRGISEITITPSTPTPLSANTVHSEDAREPSDPATPTLISDSDEDNDPPFIDAVTPPDTLRLRRIPQRRTSGTSYQQPLQPLPPPNRFFVSQPPSRKKALSAALVQKAYSLLIGPPTHLVALMLDIATKIMKGMSWERPLRGRHVPGGWESSEDEWADEDDFGIPLDNNRTRDSSTTRASETSDYDALVEGPVRSGDSVD